MTLSSTLSETFKTYCNEPSDINEHLVTLSDYARKSTSVTEFGVRKGLSSIAFLHGLAKNRNAFKILTSYDIAPSPNYEVWSTHATTSGIDFKFHIQSSLECSIDETDILFIDSLHCYGQLLRELRIHHSKVRQFLIMHDTELFGDESEIKKMPFRWSNPKKPENLDLIRKLNFDEYELNTGLWPAIVNFLSVNPDWRLEQRLTNNNGLTVLARR